jgi:single-strand DNA-binding protein
MANINRVILTGNLTRDPETRAAGQTTVTQLRLAVNSRRRDGASGQWIDEPNYFDITVWGAQGENCQRFLSKGRPVAVDGRLKWREWTDQSGQKRQAVDVVADTVQFLSGGEGGGGQGGGGYAPQQQSDVNADFSDFQRQPAAAPAGGGGFTNGSSTPADDDIPF